MRLSVFNKELLTYLFSLYGNSHLYVSNASLDNVPSGGDVSQSGSA